MIGLCMSSSQHRLNYHTVLPVLIYILLAHGGSSFIYTQQNQLANGLSLNYVLITCAFLIPFRPCRLRLITYARIRSSGHATITLLQPLEITGVGIITLTGLQQRITLWTRKGLILITTYTLHR